MKSLVLALAMALIALPAIAGEPVKTGVTLTEERVLNLPQDADKLYLTIAGNPNDATYKQVVSWFKTDSSLVSIKNGTHFNDLATNSVMFKARYSKSMPVTPIVRLQSPEGQILFEAVGNEIPGNANGLVNAINVKTEGCPWRRRRCEPKQEEAAPQEEEQPIVAPEPVKPEPEGIHPGVLFAVVAVALFVGGAIGAVQYLKRLAKPSSKSKK